MYNTNFGKKHTKSCLHHEILEAVGNHGVGSSDFFLFILHLFR